MTKAQEAVDALKDETTLLNEQDAADRRELVTPAPPGFKPKATGRLLELALIARSAMIRKGDSFWFRAEVKNAGTEPIVISDPFVKTGRGGNGWSKFRIKITPAPPEHMMFGSSGDPCVLKDLPIKGWEKLSESDKESAWKSWKFKETTLKNRVNIKLRPGETLRTRDWRQVSQEEACAAATTGGPSPSRPGGLFREYENFEDFSKPGTYTLKLVYDDPGHQPLPDEIDVLKKLGRSQEQIDSFSQRYLRKPALKAESAPISIEVMPR